MSQNNNIIKFFNDFAATFPSDRSAEKAAFEQNMNGIFNRELNLVAAMYKDKKANLTQGSILLWEDAAHATLKCGIMLATGKVLSIEESTDFRLFLQNKDYLIPPNPIDNTANNTMATILGRTVVDIVSDAFINNVKVVKEGDALVYMYKSGENKNINGGAYTLNNIGRALSLVHELIHANILASKPSVSLISDEEKQHSFIAMEKRQIIVDILLQWIDSQPAELNSTPLLPILSVIDEIIDVWLGETAINKPNVKFLCNYSLTFPNITAADNLILTKYKDEQGFVSITNRVDIPSTDILTLSKYAVKLSTDLISWYGVLRNMEGIKFICNYSLLRYIDTISTDAAIVADKAILNLYKTGNGKDNIRTIPTNDYNVLVRYADRINQDIDTIIYFEI